MVSAAVGDVHDCAETMPIAATIRVSFRTVFMIGQAKSLPLSSQLFSSRGNAEDRSTRYRSQTELQNLKKAELQGRELARSQILGHDLR